MNPDRVALDELFRVSPRNTVHLIAHYAYVPTSARAGILAAQLKSSGFQTEVRLGADGVNWLVLATHRVIPSEEIVVHARRKIEDLVALQGGEYDGWEAEVLDASH